MILLVSSVTLLYGGGQRSQNESTSPPVQPPQATPVNPIPSSPPSTLPSLGTVRANAEIGFKAKELWEIGTYSYDPDSLNEGIGGQIAEGFQPTGLQVNPGSSVIVLFSRIPLDDKRWSFLQIAPLSDVNTELSAYLVDGWIPLDFSMTPNDMHVIFAPSPTEFKSWRVASISYPESAGPRDILQLFQEPLAGQLSENRYLYGITVVDRTVHILFVESEFPPTGQRLEMFAYPNDGTSAFVGIDEQVFRGGVPAGFAYNDDWVFVPFYF